MWTRRGGLRVTKPLGHKETCIRQGSTIHDLGVRIKIENELFFYCRESLLKFISSYPCVFRIFSILIFFFALNFLHPQKSLTVVSTPGL